MLPATKTDPNPILCISPHTHTSTRTKSTVHNTQPHVKPPTTKGPTRTRQTWASAVGSTTTTGGSASTSPKRQRRGVSRCCAKVSPRERESKPGESSVRRSAGPPAQTWWARSAPTGAASRLNRAATYAARCARHPLSPAGRPRRMALGAPGHRPPSPRARLHHLRRSRRPRARRARPTHRRLPLQRKPGRRLGSTLLHACGRESSPAA